MIISPKLEHFIKADGTARIYIYIYDPSTRTKAKITTDYFVNPDNWTGSKLKEGTTNAKFINPQLLSIVSDLVNHEVKNPGLVPAQLKSWHEGPKTEHRFMGPKEYFRHYIELLKKGDIVKKYTKEKVTPGYLKALGTAATALESYPGLITWEMLGDQFFDRYVTFLRDQGFKQNTIAKYITYTVIMANHSKKVARLEYYVQKEKTQKIRLTPDEVDKIINLDLRGFPELIPEQERFEIAYSLLVRFGDSISINEKNIVLKDKRAFLSAFTQKGRKQILLPIKMSVYKILKKNDFTFKSTNKTSNDHLKRIGLMAGITSKVTITEFRNGQKSEIVYKKYQLLETHTTRRSAARNLFDSGMAPEIIMVLGGWSTMKQLLDYIDIDLEYAAGKAAKHEFFK